MRWGSASEMGKMEQVRRTEVYRGVPPANVASKVRNKGMALMLTPIHCGDADNDRRDIQKIMADNHKMRRIEPPKLLVMAFAP